MAFCQYIRAILKHKNTRQNSCPNFITDNACHNAHFLDLLHSKLFLSLTQVEMK